ncbi:CGH_1_HP_G0135630.mRNA.1.CDS.1 [Saccharomyces cerevisiae]|nr:CGH_1_HP_G0135630.mRNA.1.CDS.1 [Saccharomyces cerevisiae]CAI6983653.1 CGH_1_HP_G0135630.mRNA.1.CDS.1 [Saccharomyces cerevisiae]
MSPNLPSITLPPHSLPCPIQPYHPNHHPSLYLPPTHSPSTITVTLHLPISNSTTTYPAIPLPSIIWYSLYCCSTHHIEMLTNDRK